MTPNSPILPAEWAPQQCVLLSWPHDDTDWAYMLEEVRDCFTRVVEAILPHAEVAIVCPEGTSLPPFTRPERVHVTHMPTNDTWARDFGMICTRGTEGEIIINDFKFNGWGLKFPACHDNLITRRMIDACGLLDGKGAVYANRLDFVLEGGSVESDGRGTLLTTSECLLSPNRNGGSSKEEIIDYLKSSLGARKVLWLDHGYLAGDDTDSHIDTLARLCPGNVILYSSCDRPDDEHFQALSLMESQLAGMTDADGAPYRLAPLPIPMPIHDADGLRLPATYANFLIINGAVIVPVYGDATYDQQALRNIAAAMPGYTVTPVDCRALIQQHGSLHCVTMQLPFTPKSIT